jgi:hypothetical protein
MRKTTLAERLRLMVQAVKHDGELFDRNKVAARRVAVEQKLHKNTYDAPNRERMSERDFIRAFGDKVKKSRLSHRADFVGLVILGNSQGFMITSDDSGVRKLRLIDVDEKGNAHVTHRYLILKDKDSLSNLQRGLLKWVR